MNNPMNTSVNTSPSSTTKPQNRPAPAGIGTKTAGEQMGTQAANPLKTHASDIGFDLRIKQASNPIMDELYSNRATLNQQYGSLAAVFQRS